MASHLGLSLDAVMQQTTSSEFVAWNIYLNKEEIDGFDLSHYYLAQIAMEVRRSYVKNPKAVKFEQFMIKLETKKEEIPKPPETIPEDEQIEEKEIDKGLMDRSKRFWLGGLGMKTHGI